jgi:nitrogen fixation NifU-like protein
MDEERIREILTEHSLHPFGRCVAENAIAQSREVNPFCGDELTVFLDRTATGYRFVYQGQGCSVCMASASVLASTVQQSTLGQLRTQYQDAVACIHHSNGDDSACEEEWNALAWFYHNPRRLACVDVAWKAAAKTLTQAGEGRQEG